MLIVFGNEHLKSWGRTFLQIPYFLERRNLRLVQGSWMVKARDWEQLWQTCTTICNIWMSRTQMNQEGFCWEIGPKLQYWKYRKRDGKNEAERGGRRRRWVHLLLAHEWKFTVVSISSLVTKDKHNWFKSNCILDLISNGKLPSAVWLFLSTADQQISAGTRWAAQQSKKLWRNLQRKNRLRKPSSLPL